MTRKLKIQFPCAIPLVDEKGLFHGHVEFVELKLVIEDKPYIEITSKKFIDAKETKKE